MGEKIAWIGLGVMGYPMAGRLRKAGHELTVYNRSSAKAEQWVGEYGGRRAATPREAVEGASVVFACVGNDDDLRSVVTGANGAFSGMGEGGLFVDHTTASAEVARELHAAGMRRQIGFVDAPVSGGQAGAENGALSVMCGGEKADYERAVRFIECYSKKRVFMGPSGAGQLTKCVNQICIAGLVQSLAEGIHFAKKAGLDIDATFDVISSGAAQSWQMENRYKTMKAGEYEHGFAVDWMRKDLDICLSHARKVGAHLPVVALVDQFYSQVQEMGGKRWDTSSLLALLEGSKHRT